jgi:AcrR family transcriptional regulator
MVLFGTNARKNVMRPKNPAPAPVCEPGDDANERLRGRIIGAAFKLLMERGYAGTSTLEIATQAKVSKRELYALFGSKHGILMQMIAIGAARMQVPLHLPEPQDRQSLATMLVSFGATTMREVSSPVVMAVYRLAASEAERSTEVAAALEVAGRQATRNALADLLRRAQARGLLGAGKPDTMATQFFALLWGDLLLRQVLRLAPPPSQAEAEARAGAATDALFTLYPPRAL